MNKKPYIPNRLRAVTDATIATYYQGQRIVRKYKSGEPLVGEIRTWDGPRYLGHVRRFGKKKAGK